MTTTREMLDEACLPEHRQAVGMDCGADGPDVQVGVDACKEPGPDAYDDLRQATPQELLGAVEWVTRQSDNDQRQIRQALSFLHLGFALAQPGGWAHVAPYWLRESKKERDIEQYNNWTGATTRAEVDGDE